MKAWDIVQLARHSDRPTAAFYIKTIFDEFIELHGDRYFGDDSAITAGIGSLNGTPVTIVAQEKGVTLPEKLQRNFGNANPDGYRKALRLMKQAEKFNRPIICFVDTQGAACGIEAEERGQGEAIASNLKQMFTLSVPIIAVVLSEGGSGGALGIAVADEVYMLQNSFYSVLSPEGFASILWKDSTKAEVAADVMKITAADLFDLGIVDGIIHEPTPAHQSPGDVAESIKNTLTSRLSILKKMDKSTLMENRYQRFRKF